MKVQVIYSSLSGCTRRLAEGIFNGLNVADKTIHDLKDGEPALDGEVILLGYWVDKGGPNAQMKALMEKVEGKKVGVFCTLGFWADSTHAQGSLHNGVELLKEKNIILGGYVCNGALSQQMIDAFRSRTSGPHCANPASEARWALMKDHPTQCEIALAVERFNERLIMLEKLSGQGIEFASINI